MQKDLRFFLCNKYVIIKKINNKGYYGFGNN